MSLIMPQGSSKTNFVLTEDLEPPMITILKWAICDNKLLFSIREFSKLVKTQKERKSDKNSPQPPAAASSELFEMKDQMQTVTAILSDMNVQNIPQDTNDRQYRLDGNTNYPANS